MASTWQGFTEEDQAKIKYGYADSVLRTNESPVLAEVQLGNKKKDRKIIKKIVSIHSEETTNLPNEDLFVPKSRGKGTESPSHVKLKIAENSSSFEILEAKPMPGNESEDLKTAMPQAPVVQCNGSPNPTIPVDLLQNGEKKDPVNLEEFEKRQKLIEEQNRLKKEMLGKALALRKKKTEDEAVKLHQIQEELSRLDASLSNDVGILRSHIEVASVELAEAEKRYVKAEREFIEAKQLLFNKRERKDLLTEHLCAIIEQNELRKAHRLTNLMVQLNEQDLKAEAAMTQIVEPTKLT